jgi:hypothetical protein
MSNGIYVDASDKIVLDLIKKYPIYSVEQLHQRLPLISREKIQAILEKNHLSRIDQRFEYAREVKGEERITLSQAKKPSPKMEEFRNRLVRLRQYWQNRQPGGLGKTLKTILLIGGWLTAGGIFIYSGINQLKADKVPYIELQTPENNQILKGEGLFVSGKVMPVGVVVTINDQAAYLNGDGSFTALVKLPEGQSVLKVKAVKGHQVAEVIRLVERQLTKDEIQAKQKQTEEKQARLNNTVNDILAAAKVNDNQKNLKVINNRLVKEGDFTRIVGEVVNHSTLPVNGVTITAYFWDQSGNIIDTKYGFTQKLQADLMPEETATFETQPTLLSFTNYRLEINYNEGLVAGTATDSAAITRP